MVTQRGEIWWANLPMPHGSEPGFRRPLIIVQGDAFNRSRIQTVVAIAVTSNLQLLDAPGNVLVPARSSGLPSDSVANVSQIVTVDRDALSDRAGRLSSDALKAVDKGLKLVLDL